jgi:hypothetical protein
MTRAVVAVCVAISLTGCGEKPKATARASGDTTIFVPPNASVADAALPAAVGARKPVDVPPPQPAVTPPTIDSVIERVPPRRPPPVTPRAADPERLHSIVFTTSPPGARVRLKSTTTGKVYEHVSPWTFSVPSEVFSWEVELANYLPDQSRQRMVDVVAKSSDSVDVALTPAGDRKALLQRADVEFAKPRGAGCAEAIRLYESVAQPNDVSGSVGAEWRESRLKEGQCFELQHEYDKAIHNFEQVLSAEKGQWSAKYELGVTQCAAKDFAAGNQNLREMGGPFLGQVSAELKEFVRSIARYGSGLCKFNEFSGKSQPERFPDLRDQAISSFEEFMSTGESLLSGRLSNDLKSSISRDLADAKAKHKQLTGS